MVEPNSIVHWFPEKECHSCGYCNNPSGSVQYGMWAQSLTVGDYQDLLDRGWRRSGQYCYKPVMTETCCPLYTIRCDGLAFKLSKSQKKVIKKMNKFLKTGVLNNIDKIEASVVFEEREGIMDECKECPIEEVDPKNFSQVEDELCDENDKTDCDNKVRDFNNIAIVTSDNAGNSNHAEETCLKSPPKEGIGADPNRPPCKKAKIIRLEKKIKKLESSGQSVDQSISKQQQVKSLEEFLNEVSSDDKNKLTIKLIEASKTSSEWKKYEQMEYELYKKYQNIVHNDPPEKNTLTGFLRFLVNTPLKKEKPKGLSDDIPAYGSYHQQYWLNDKLIAVGVIDILPKCVTAVYFFYDPDYRELTLGTYGALKEIELSRKLAPHLNTQFYYMGYYSHSCKKMRYKSHMHPSFLLCAETYTWFPIEKCLRSLDESKYCRFNEDPSAVDKDDCTDQHLNNIQIVIRNRFMTYRKYRTFYNKEEIYKNIGKLIGKKCIKTLIFIES